MGNVVIPQITRMRARFDASPPVNEVLNRFYEVPNGRFSFYSTAQRLISVQKAGSEFNDKLKYLEENVLPKLGRNALILAPPIGVMPGPLYDKYQFGVQNPDTLEEVIETLNELPGSFPASSSNTVEVVLERRRYKNDFIELQTASQALQRVLGSDETLTVGRPKLEADPMVYSLVQKQFTPLDPRKA